MEDIKYIVLIGDGMADRPINELGGLTPLQKAHTPNMDTLAANGIIGSSKTIPEGFAPGSDVANLSILGYDPRLYYTGRAPLEAASMGIPLKEGDVAYRCNLVSVELPEGGSEAVMKDYSAGHISSREAKILIEAINNEFQSAKIRFYPGVSYRHLMVWTEGKADVVCTPPHDITGREIAGYMPVGDGEETLNLLMASSVKALKDHDVNKARRAGGKAEANCIWLWGQGKKPALPTFKEKYSKTGALISAVDLTKGLGIYAGFDIIDVPGATGWLDTNYLGKAAYGIEALGTHDLVYIHVEAPDECGHTGNLKDKLQAIEDFDRLVVGEVLRGVKEFPHYRILLMPDHATPVAKKTHTDEPVPFVIYDNTVTVHSADYGFDESICQSGDAVVFEEGFKLMDYFINPNKPK
jgi:2,3-bisphosphoglycerate-independent phosphoglycerate mutase